MGVFGKALDTRQAIAIAPAKAEYNARPLSVECRVKLRSSAGYNILVAHGPKSSAIHWELFTVTGSGTLALYMPGSRPDHVHSNVAITDDQWHDVGFALDEERGRLFIDGKLVADQAVQRTDPAKRQAPPEKLTIGQLVEGGIGCDGLIDDLRISQNLRDGARAPWAGDAATLAQWHFDESDTAKSFTDASGRGNDATRTVLTFQNSAGQAFAVAQADPYARMPESQVAILPPPADVPALHRLLSQALAEVKLPSLGSTADCRDALLRDYDEQYWHLANRISGKEALPGKSEQAFERQALCQPDDGDPLGTVLRQMSALLTRLESLPAANTAKTGTPDRLKPELQPLRDSTAPVLPGLERDLAALKALTASVPVTDTDRRKGLFLAACLLRRQVAFANPLLDFERILFIARGVDNGSRAFGQRGTNDRQGQHFQTQYFGFNALPGGGLYTVRNFKTKPEVVDLLKDAKVENGRLAGKSLQGGAFLAPDLAYDGRSIMFSWTGNTALHCYKWTPETTWKIFRVNADGTGLVQLTDGPWDDFDACHLPNGRIAFVSERRGGYIRCFGGLPVPQHSLHSMKADGSDILRLSYFETGEWQPSVDNHGMLVYTRWDYVDRENCLGSNFWISFPDGRNPRAPHGNYPYPWHTFPDNKLGDSRRGRPMTEMSIRAVPGSPRYIATAAPHHGEAFGSLVMLDLEVPDDNVMSQVKRVTPYVRFPESEQGPRLQYPYGTAWPLSEDFYLCNYWENLYLLDRFGNQELLCENSLLFAGKTNYTMRLIDPMPLKARPVPPAIPSGINDGADARPDAPTATVAVMNVYDSDQPWPPNTTIKYLRVLQDIPKDNPQMNEPRDMGYHWENTPRVPLGIVPVEADGSVYFNAPVERELIFQAVDENFMAVQSMRSVAYVHRGERLTCAGCHEDKTKTSVVVRKTATTPAALRRAPSDLQPEAGPVEPITFYRLVQPVFEKSCVTCHRKEGKGPQDMSFEALRPYVCYFSGGMSGSVTLPNTGGSRSIPGRMGARGSRLGQALLSPVHKGKIAPEDYRRVVLWLDANAMRLGAFHDEEKQMRGELVWPKLDVDPANPQGLERPRPASVAANPVPPGDTVAPQAGRLLMITSHSPSAVNIVDGDGRSVWSLSDGVKHPQDAAITADGNLFCSVLDGAIMVRLADKRLLWRYTVPAGCQNPVAQPLGNGRFLVGNEGPCKLLEIDATGAVLTEVRGQSKFAGNHAQFRLSHKTSEGTYLFAMTGDKAVREYDAAGKLLFEIPGLGMCCNALRLPGGNTLIANNAAVEEYDRQGKLTWRFDAVADGRFKPALVVGLTRLRNGNTIFTYYHQDPALPDVIEVSPEKKMVASLILPALNNVVAIQVLDAAMKPNDEVTAR